MAHERPTAYSGYRDAPILAGKIAGTEARRTAMAGHSPQVLGNRVVPAVEELADAIADA